MRDTSAPTDVGDHFSSACSFALEREIADEIEIKDITGYLLEFVTFASVASLVTGSIANC